MNWTDYALIGVGIVLAGLAFWGLRPRRRVVPSAENGWRQRGVGPEGMTFGLFVDAANGGGCDSGSGGGADCGGGGD